MSELKSVVVIVCCMVGIVLLVGGWWMYNYTQYPDIPLSWEPVYPYRIYGFPFVICGIALLFAGVTVYFTVKASGNS